MADIQRHFETFVNTIKLSGEEEILRQKRTAIVDALRIGLERDFKARGEAVPTFTHFNQGSYSLKTGVKPEGSSNDYDIDVGIVFAEDPKDHADDPVKLKRWVRDALDGHTKDIRIKTPCVTVMYQVGYHVDLAVYAHPDKKTSGELPLSWGKEHAAVQEWQDNHPSKLADLIKQTFPDKEQRRQFRRVLRALKRWRDRKYKSATSHAAPVGVGLTVAGLTWFRPQIDTFNQTANDRLATELFVRQLLANFRDGVWSSKDEASGRRLVVKLPFTPYKDVFERINNSNMGKLEGFLKSLLADLETAGSASSTKDACAAMRRQFGPDFPEGDDTDGTTEGSKKHPPVIVPSHTSG
ncbi:MULTISPECIES: nucleotidyltransferase [unclassified Deinococcus]|uniref:nucleotidyltransferase domain-containing protein n=1 Tax=unclassified Deinococcus TaxID=2623546 RepID=UPI00099349A1|nr:MULTISPECIES: nucleotidyltransferase [unclassified Deinococcus]MBX8466881.1 nucleotidyltransferase [Deinococcus sp. RIT780]OOV12107.1 hypothetical protein BXU09_17465 [Deinococcus sp. LM3]